MAINIEEVKLWIAENPKVIRTLHDVAIQWHCSAETLRKEFWRKEKSALGEFIQRARIEKTKKSLIETDLLCKEICFEVGFLREDTGAEVFKRKVGMTMKEFRAASTNGNCKQGRVNKNGEVEKTDSDLPTKKTNRFDKPLRPTSKANR